MVDRCQASPSHVYIFICVFVCMCVRRRHSANHPHQIGEFPLSDNQALQSFLYFHLTVWKNSIGTRRWVRACLFLHIIICKRRAALKVTDHCPILSQGLSLSPPLSLPFSGKNSVIFQCVSLEMEPRTLREGAKIR